MVKLFLGGGGGLGDDAANGSPILSLIFNEISELLVNKEYEFKQRRTVTNDVILDVLT
jgi:hypothetical protein